MASTRQSDSNLPCGKMSKMVSKPHGGRLISVGKLNTESYDKGDLTLEVDSRTAINLFLIKNGIFSPLASFNTREDYGY